MAKKVITIPRNATQWGGKSFNQCMQERDFGAICENCGKEWGSHHDKECPKYEKTITIKPVKSECVKFQPQVEKELLRLGIKHTLLAEMKLQSKLSRLNYIKVEESTRTVIHNAFTWNNARRPINRKHQYLHWTSLINRARN